MTLPRLVILISGSGTNLQALIDAVQSGDLKAEIVLVVSNRKAAYGLSRAEAAGIPTWYFPLKPYLENEKSRTEYDTDLAQKITTYQPNLIVLVGWMHVLSPAFLKRFPGKVINLHPALPGMFPGTDAIARAFEAYEQGEINESGCMVHEVITEIDAGRVIAQAVVPFESGDTLAAFETRIHSAEHRLIVEAVKSVLA